MSAHDGLKRLFTPMKTKAVRARRGRPELTQGEREERDRPIVEPLLKMLDRRQRAGDSYAKARSHAIQHAAEMAGLDESTVRKIWKRWEPGYRAIDQIAREHERAIKAASTLRPKTQGK